MYPVMLDVEGQRCLVVGGGGVALRKADGLLKDGALVTVVASSPMEAMQRLNGLERMHLERRRYKSGDVRGFRLVFAASNDRNTNRQVFEEASRLGIWVNVADDPELCTFHLPARVRRGTLQLAIGSAGDAPFVVRRLRQLLEKHFGPEWAEWLDAAARFRSLVREQRFDLARQEASFDSFFEHTVDSENLTARVPTAQEVADFLHREAPGWVPAVAAAHEQRRNGSALPEQTRAGRVALVGAGPGDPGLMTIRGRQRLMEADVVIYDRLAATALPCDLPAQVELHCVGKQANRHPVPQEEINRMLVRFARQGKRVVRLKGGDPFVFGRGSEEAEWLAAAGIPFEVVPAVTAGMAVPAYAGIPVTHRNQAVRVTLLTAHEAVKSGGPQQRWDLLAADRHATILGYMGVSTLGQVVDKLLAAGLDPETPAAMIERGTTSRQRVVKSRVADLPEAIEAAHLGPPSLFVIGPTVAHAENLDWFSERPLMGERLVIVSPAADLGRRLEELGAELVELQLPVTPAARVVMDALPITGHVLRSVEEINGLEGEWDRHASGPEVVAWCLGSAVAARASASGWQQVRELDPANPLATRGARPLTQNNAALLT